MHLSDRRFTWNNGRDVPTLERLDRAFASTDWFTQFPSHHLRGLSSDCTDHAPLLLVLNTSPWARPRFRFENFWTRIEGFLDVLSMAWATNVEQVDACRAVDMKLCATAKALRSWRDTCVGDIRLKLAAARAVILELDLA